MLILTKCMLVNSQIYCLMCQYDSEIEVYVFFNWKEPMQVKALR